MSTQKERVILGCMAFSPDLEKGGQVNTIEATRKITDCFKSRGYNEIDTARVYHDRDNEGWMRQVGWKESGFEVATKVLALPPPHPSRPANIPQNSTPSPLASTNRPLSRVDIWYLHAAHRSIPSEETLEEVDMLHREGKFKTLGLSNFTAFRLRSRRCAVYNAITRMIEAELVVACRRYGLDIVVYNPRWFLLRQIPHQNNPHSNHGTVYRERYFRDAYFRALDILEPLCAKHNIGLLETSLRWLIHHSALKMRSKGGNGGIILGVSRIEKLRVNLDNLEKGPLPEEALEALEEAWVVCKPVCRK
ncbi:aflatoxin B1 aldehyde reductase member 2 [Tirmania nivea]|nr:aflatoxin B1 aldehyde reductase member 2 [Tirmania nivea]